MTITCTKCGKPIEKYLVLDSSEMVCSICYNLCKSYEILYKDQKAKFFVDVFSINGVNYYNVFAFDIVGEIFQTITMRSDITDIIAAKYDVIICVCNSIVTDLNNVVIYTDFKTLMKHIEKAYKIRSKMLKDSFWKLKGLMEKGLEIKYIEPEFNMARVCPTNFTFYQKFDGYNRKSKFQMMRGDKSDLTKEKTIDDDSNGRNDDTSIDE